MNGTLSITLRLDRNECVRGESVYFDVTLANTGRTRLTDLPTLDPMSRAIRLVADGPGGPRAADALSADERDGVDFHAPRGAPPTVDLDPGQKLELRDDLLSWFGELEPGTYQITARTGLDTVSAPVALKVLRANPQSLTTPRFAAGAPAALLTGAWTHDSGDGKVAAGAVLFFQQQSPAVPRNSRHGLRVAQTKLPVEAHAATVPYGEITRGHVLWLDERGRLLMAQADLVNPRLSPEIEVQTPFKGILLASAVTRPDGGLWVPWTDEKREKVAILSVSATGDSKPYALDLDKTKPLGPYACFWEYLQRLHFLWAAPRGREIQYARLPLDDPGSGFVVRSVAALDDPIMWIDAYLDADVASRAAPYFEEQIPPDQRGTAVQPPGPTLMLWVVTGAAGSPRCARVEAATGYSKPAAMLPTGAAQGLHVVASVVTYTHELALLLADAKDQLYYASTTRGKLVPLAEAAGRQITLADHPGLMTATSQGRDPWVYLRYIQDKRAIGYIRLEPAADRDPVERQQDLRSARGTLRR
jgi:hypothetical protein